jgi:hypothetical protein
MFRRPAGSEGGRAVERSSSRSCRNPMLLPSRLNQSGERMGGAGIDPVEAHNEQFAAIVIPRTVDLAARAADRLQIRGIQRCALKCVARSGVVGYVHDR